MVELCPCKGVSRCYSKRTLWFYSWLFIAAAVAVLFVPAKFPDKGQQEQQGKQEQSQPIEITSADDGYATANKFTRLYVRGLAKLLPDIVARVRNTEDSSYDIAKAWAAASEAARIEATKGVNERVKALVADQSMTRQQKADWIAGAQKAWEEQGK